MSEAWIALLGTIALMTLVARWLSRQAITLRARADPDRSASPGALGEAT